MPEFKETVESYLKRIQDEISEIQHLTQSIDLSSGKIDLYQAKIKELRNKEGEE